MRRTLLAVAGLVLLVGCRPKAPTPTPPGACPEGAICVFDGEQLIEVWRGADDQGNFDAVETYTYAAGLLIRADYDDLCDGTIDEIRHFTHVDGALRSEVVDRHADGTEDERYVYATDTNGALTTRWEDFDGNGEAERTCVFDPPCANPMAQGECARECNVGGGQIP